MLLGSSSARANAAAITRASRLIVRGDGIYARSQTPGATWTAIGFYREALKQDQRSFAALWRTARAFARLADHARARQRPGGVFGRQGYDYAFRAIQSRPRRVEGHYWAAICVGEYGNDMGILTAVRKGIGGKFLRYLRAALRIDPAYDDGGPYRILAMYHYRMPWPMKSHKKALRFLRRSLIYSPSYGITHAMLAQILADQGRATDARRHIKACLRARATGQHPQIIKRYQRQCTRMSSQ